MAKPEEMYQCQVSNCGWIYDPDKGDAKGGIKAGVAFKDVPDTWVCPSCGATKKSFRPLAGPGSGAQPGIAGAGRCRAVQCLRLRRSERGAGAEAGLTRPGASRSVGRSRRDQGIPGSPVSESKAAVKPDSDMVIDTGLSGAATG